VIAVPYEFSVKLPAARLVPAVYQALVTAGFSVTRSFDLRSALAALPDPACPHHGLAPCDCQYCVLLVYGQGATPETLIVHGNDARCWIALAEPWAGQAMSELATDIVHVLVAAHLIDLAWGQEDGDT
jgi:hypothetical protein